MKTFKTNILLYSILLYPITKDKKVKIPEGIFHGSFLFHANPKIWICATPAQPVPTSSHLAGSSFNLFRNSKWATLTFRVQECEGVGNLYPVQVNDLERLWDYLDQIFNLFFKKKNFFRSGFQLKIHDLHVHSQGVWGKRPCFPFEIASVYRTSIKCK